MGQALYDAQAAYFRRNQFYFETSQSPFLIVQSGPTLLRGEVTHMHREGSPQLRFGFERYFPADLHHAATIEAVEDAYMAVEPDCVDRPPCMFAINAQSSIQASRNRRGTGWVVCCSLATLNAIIAPDDLRHFEPTRERTIGRWTLRASKVDRCQHFWTADHLPDGDVWTFYRDCDAGRLHDGLPVLRIGDGYAYPDPLPHYVMRRRYNG